jgi:hypothetical protein
MQKRYMVDGNLKNDSQYYNTGDIIVIDEAQAAPLVAIGRLKQAVEDITPPQASAQATPDGFPQRDSDVPPAPQQSAPAPAQPAQQAVPQVDPEQPKQPTPEEVAATAASVQ